MTDLVYLWCGHEETISCKFSPDLEWSIKSVKMNMRWIRNIYVIVSADFIAKEVTPGVKYVNMATFVPKKYLPTNNSNVVESWLFKMKGLSECFIYMCDDMYIGRPVDRAVFFAANDMPIVRVDEGATRHPPLSQLSSDALTIPYVRMWANMVEKHNLNFTRIAHQALSYRVSHMKKFYKQWKKEVDLASINKERKGEFDFNLLRFTSSFSIMSGDALMRVTNNKFDYFTESTQKEKIKMIPRLKPTFFCINNSFYPNSIAYKMLKRYFTKKMKRV